MGRSEELGTGVQNVFRYNKIYSNVDENKFIEDDIFVTTVPLKILKETNEPLNEPLNDRQKEIIVLIKNNKHIIIKDLMDNLNAGRETIKRDINKLQEANIIKRVGSRKTGYWEIIK